MSNPKKKPDNEHIEAALAKGYSLERALRRLAMTKQANVVKDLVVVIEWLSGKRG